MNFGKKPAKNRRSARNAIPYGIILIGLILAASLIALVVLIPAQGDQEALPAATTTTYTQWPYGLPEFHVEVPEGYEGLLPGEPQEGEPTNATSSPSALGATYADDAGASKTAVKTYIETVMESGSRQEAPALIIVIDDAGYNLDQLEPFLQLPFPLTIAVLPGVEHSIESARRAAEAGKEVILHQPMQAIGGNNTGPGAILLGMGQDEAKKILAANLDLIPEAAGLNNHMGSAVTRESALMRPVLDLAKARGIYYLDSLTAPGTATAELCEELSIPYWERDVFLDNSGDRQSMLRALEDGKKVATNRGASVLIGHVWTAELAQTLMEVYPKLVDEGYSLTTISRFMLRSALEDDDARPRD